MSEDAVQYAPDKTAAVREAARILRPGGRFVFTAFELEPEHVKGLPVIGEDPVDDYRPLLSAAGFNIETWEEVPGLAGATADDLPSPAGRARSPGPGDGPSRGHGPLYRADSDAPAADLPPKNPCRGNQGTRGLSG